MVVWVQGAVSVLAGHPAGSCGPGGGAVPGAEPDPLLQRQRGAGGGGGVLLYLLRVSLPALLTHREEGTSALPAGLFL